MVRPHRASTDKSQWTCTRFVFHEPHASIESVTWARPLPRSMIRKKSIGNGYDQKTYVIIVTKLWSELASGMEFSYQNWSELHFHHWIGGIREPQKPWIFRRNKACTPLRMTERGELRPFIPSGSAIRRPGSSLKKPGNCVLQTRWNLLRDRTNSVKRASF